MVFGHKLRGEGQLMKKLSGQRKGNIFFIMICGITNIEIFIFNYIMACFPSFRRGMVMYLIADQLFITFLMRG
jgi:hypothetical protein